MWPYVITFGLSCLSAAMADRYRRRQKKRYFFFFSALAVLIGAALAGLRASSVGTDMLVYGNSVFKAACKAGNPFPFIAQYQKDAGIEPLYLALNYVVSRFTGDAHWFYFVLQLLTILFVYQTIVAQQKTQNTDVWLGLLVYYTLFYPFSLNGMRQALAMSIVFWATTHMYKRKLHPFVLSIVLAAGFHYSAILCLAFYPLYRYIRISKNRELAILTIVAALAVVCINNQVFIRLLSLLVPKYSRYLTDQAAAISINPLLLRAPFILVYILFYSRYKKRNACTDIWLTLLCADAMLALLRGVMPTLYRISLYFGMIKICAYPSIDSVFNKASKKYVKGALVIMLSAIWYYQTVYQGNESVYPYVSDVLSWLN